MTIEQQVIQKLRGLSPDKQQEVLEFVDTIAGEGTTRKPLPSLRGLWKDFNIDITDEDIAEARREMWAAFPRDVS